MSLRFVRLDRPAVRRLKPGEKIIEHGITVERLRNGDVRYTVAIMVDGRRIHRVIGTEAGGVTRRQAEEFIEKLRTEAREGRLSLPKGRKVKLTFGAAAKVYMDRLRESGGKGLEEKEQHLRIHLVPAFGNMPIDKISTFTLEKFRKASRGCGLKTGTINRVLVTYRHMANKLHEWKKIGSPMAMIKLEGVDNRRDFILTTDQKIALLDTALGDSNDRLWLFVMLGLHTSLRHAEILSARFENFDSSRRRLRVRVKGGEWREQPLTRTIVEALERERSMAADPDGWVFPNPRSSSGHTERMKKAFRRAVIGAGMDPTKVTPHTMRHTAITEMAETGAAPRTIQAFSGHKSKEMVWRYTHARDELVNQALDQFDSVRTKEERQLGQKRSRS